MLEPTIKGTAFESAVVDLCALVESGRLTREELEVRLTPDEIGYLEGKISPGFWYPMKSYMRLLELIPTVQLLLLLTITAEFEAP